MKQVKMIKRLSVSGFSLRLLAHALLERFGEWEDSDQWEYQEYNQTKPYWQGLESQQKVKETYIMQFDT